MKTTLFLGLIISGTIYTMDTTAQAEDSIITERIKTWQYLQPHPHYRRSGWAQLSMKSDAEMVYVPWREVELNNAVWRRPYSSAVIWRAVLDTARVSYDTRTHTLRYQPQSGEAHIGYLRINDSSYNASQTRIPLMFNV